MNTEGKPRCPSDFTASTSSFLWSQPGGSSARPGPGDSGAHLKRQWGARRHGQAAPQACHLANCHGNPGRLSITVHGSQSNRWTSTTAREGNFWKLSQAVGHLTRTKISLQQRAHPHPDLGRLQSNPRLGLRKVFLNPPQDRRLTGSIDKRSWRSAVSPGNATWHSFHYFIRGNYMYYTSTLNPHSAPNETQETPVWWQVLFVKEMLAPHPAGKQPGSEAQLPGKRGSIGEAATPKPCTPLLTFDTQLFDSHLHLTITCMEGNSRRSFA